MLIRVTFEPEENERKVLDALIGMFKKEDEGVFKEPLTAEDTNFDICEIAEPYREQFERALKIVNEAVVLSANYKIKKEDKDEV